MKYIKKFNEELNANTYIKVAKSLKDLKHNKRAKYCTQIYRKWIIKC